MLLCAGLAATACYQPSPAVGLPCSAGSRECPDGQSCGADNICRQAGGGGADAEVCSATTCQVEVLAASATAASADIVLATHPDYVFWTSAIDRAVLRTSKATKETVILDQRGAPYSPLGLAADDSVVYWSDSRSSGAVLFTAVNGTGSAQQLAVGQDFALYLTSDADNVYWSNASGLIIRATKSGGVLTQVAASLGDGPAGALLLDGNTIYFADQGGGRVFSVPNDNSGELAVVSANQGSPLGVGVDASYVYWANSDGDEIKRRSKIGGQVELVADQQPGASFIAVGPNDIYWTDREGGRVMRASKTGGRIDALVEGQDEPYGIALDGDALYWVNRAGDNRLMRLYPCACP
ncbi:MAG TPA: hypothetical protein VKB80_20410 [Kofleriaceae bacterium]|nr:hypothetical protein [Kofleriaceae bacterium]